MLRALEVLTGCCEKFYQDLSSASEDSRLSDMLLVIELNRLEVNNIFMSKTVKRLHNSQSTS